MEATLVLAKMVFQCGCGFKTDTKELAAEHCRKTGHIMTVSGQLFRLDKKP